MTITNWRLTGHARRRLAQRNLQPQELELVIEFGRVAHCAGATFYFLGERDLPQGLEKQLEHLVGVTLVLADGYVLTAYRNRRAWAAIKRKGKWPKMSNASLQ